MDKIIKRIMLVDDNPHDNFFHEREIKKANKESTVIVKNSAKEALDYLSSKKNDPGAMPDLIFLDINMPGMNGWEFLKAYNLLDKEIKNGAIIIMLTTSSNPDDMSKVRANNLVFDYITKPLTKEIMQDILSRYSKQQVHL
jgi:CheY-like chemotaxis protein